MGLGVQTLFDIDRHHNFSFKFLDRYKFTLSEINVYVYDSQGKIWREPEIFEKIEKRDIVRIMPQKWVSFSKSRGILGYIQECPDGTWLAHSSYYINEKSLLDGTEIFGFSDEFFAIRYLHQIMGAAFLDFGYESVPPLPQEYEIGLDYPKKDIFLEDLDALIGCVQRYGDGIWFSYSPYYPQATGKVEAIGFISEFYAVRYLYQIVATFFYDLVDETIIPPLLWETSAQ